MRIGAKESRIVLKAGQRPQDIGRRTPCAWWNDRDSIFGLSALNETIRLFNFERDRLLVDARRQYRSHVQGYWAGGMR